jgi:hypothetical protein
MSSPASRLKYLYLAYLSRPSEDRQLYRLIRRRQLHNLVEIGIGLGQRAQRMIEVAQASPQSAAVRYTGIDLFELRPAEAGPGLPLKEAYRRLRATGVHVQVVPGDPYAALSRVANTLVGTDLVVISGHHDPQSLARAWFYVPRMLHDRSAVYVETAEGASRHLRPMSRSEIDALATTMRRAA